MKKTFVSRTMTCLAALLMLTGGWRTDAAYLADALNEVYEVSVDTQNRPFAWPIPDSNSISSCFKDGREHNAIDIPAPQGTRVNAAADGVVTVAATGCTHNYGKSKSCGCNNGAGNYIMIRHDIGGTTYYTCPLKPRSLDGRTGRGDTTFSTYITERQRKGIQEALNYATQLVSLKMETPGPFKGSRADVEAFAAEFY